MHTFELNHEGNVYTFEATEAEISGPDPLPVLRTPDGQHLQIVEIYEVWPPEFEVEAIEGHQGPVRQLRA
jgi:hypothetical protein